MNATTTLLVLAAALLHATWNALLKSGADRLRAITIMTVAGTAVTVPAVFVLPGLPFAVWPMMTISVVLHIGYNILLVSAYGQGDLGQVYPIARGSSPLLVTFGALAVAGERPAPAVLVGVVLVSIGIVSLAHGWSGASRRGVLTALATGAFIAGYTLSDALGARLSGQPISYAAWMFLFDGIVMSLVYLGMRGVAGARLTNGPEIIKAGAGGVVSVLAYGIVIWAASVGPMGPVSALRETSVVDAVLIGRLFLGERLTARRLGSCLLVAFGAIVLGWHA